VANNVEESQHLLEQDMDIIGASSHSSSSPFGSHLCLMAKDSKKSSSLKSSTYGDDEDEDIYDPLKEKGMIIYHDLPRGSKSCSLVCEILTYAIESRKIIDEKCRLEREYANEIASLENSLEEEQETRVALEEQLESIEKSYNKIIAKLTKRCDLAQASNKSLEETFTLDLSKVEKTRDRALEMAIDLKIKYNELNVMYTQLNAHCTKDLAKMSSPIIIDNDACATNSTSCEASILKENVELKAQLDLLTSKYGMLEESHEKLSSSNDDLLASYARLKLAHEACSSKVTSCEPHVDISTTCQNAILPCASPSSSSTHDIAKSCDELLALSCCSNNKASTSTSSCIVTNHVGEINELKAQVASLKQDLVKSHKGKATLDKVLSVQKSPNDKRGLGFESNIKNKSKNKNKKDNKKKGQEQVKDSANIICFKCKIEGHHVRSCPLKKEKSSSEKQQGKRPQLQGQAHAQPQVEKRPPPKKALALAPQVKNTLEKRKGSRCCYLCRKKGHLASSCTSGTSSNPIMIDDVYSLRKDEVGNVFAKYVGTQSGVKKRTIWVAKPIVTNFLGPNLVGDQQAKT
jgi:hypothetical protein